MSQPTADLVEHGQGHRPQLVGPPQLLHGRQDPLAGRVLVTAELVVERPQLAEDPRQLADRRATARLGRVRGHHQPDLSPTDEARDLRADAPRSAIWHTASSIEPFRGSGYSRAVRARMRLIRSLSSARLTS